MEGLVVPGQSIPCDVGFLRGHGTYLYKFNNDNNEMNNNDDIDNEMNNDVDNRRDVDNPLLISSVAGQIERVNKLISVRPVKCRYIAEIGDLVVGRITNVESKRWKADIGSQKDATLQLSSVNLPGGVQRIRTYEDQLQMRTLFAENDLISAEVQNVGSDGSLSLHTRSLKYGKLENGQLIIVPASLVKRLPQHYISLPWGVDIILGKNGYIWITRTIPEDWKIQEGDIDDSTPLAETLQKLQQKHILTPILVDERLRIVRVRNSIEILSKSFITITPQTIAKVYIQSENLKIAEKDMLANIDILISSLF